MGQKGNHFNGLTELAGTGGFWLNWIILDNQLIFLLTDESILAVGSAITCVRIFKYINDDWSQLGGLISGRGCQTVSLSHDGNTVAIEFSNLGVTPTYAHVYHWNDIAWNQVGDDILGTPNCLSGNGTVLAIGSADLCPGYVKVFKLDAKDTWTQVGDNIYGDSWRVLWIYQKMEQSLQLMAMQI